MPTNSSSNSPSRKYIIIGIIVLLIIIALLWASCSDKKESLPVATTPATMPEPPKPEPSIADLSKPVYFDFDQSAVKSEAQTLLDANAKYLNADKSRKVVIEGYADERGSKEYNLALGQRRGEAVRKALEMQGVASSQVEVASFGEEKPAAQGHNEAAWVKNRRAEFSYR